MRGTRAVIHLDNLEHNIKEIRKKTGNKVLRCLPVKADAYGHGAVPVAKRALECGVDFLAVATVGEGAELRDAGIKAPVLLFSIPADEELESLVRNNLTPFVSDESFILKLEKAASSFFSGKTSGGKNFLPVHLKIETGMGRTGCRPEDAVKLAALIGECPSLELNGAATHFAVSDSSAPEDILFTKKQIEVFSRTVGNLRSAGFDPGIVHASSSGGIIFHDEAWFSMVRPGILAYGYPPSRDAEGKLDLKPVMELQSEIVFVKDCPKGTSISYGRTWISQEDCKIATVCAGYADGIRRDLSPGLSVEAAGKSCPVRGRICMDQFMVELPAGMNTPVPGTPVVIFGPPPCLFSAADLAEIAGTIPYEITCGISSRVPRVYAG